MRRRELIAALASVIATKGAAVAQQKTTSLVGLLDAAGPIPLSLSGIRKGLAETGFHDGENVVIRHSAAGGHYDRLPSLVADLLRDRVDLIIAPQLPSALAAKAATTSVPIVFMLGDDPIKQGLVDGLSRPGGNATGLSMLAAGLDTKRLQVLHDLVPNAARFGVLVNPGNLNLETQISETQAAARALTRETEIFRARNEQEIDAAFAAMTEHEIAALVVGADPFFNSRAQQIVALAEHDRVPSIYEWRTFVDIGGLASYGSNLDDNYRKLGIYAGGILGGAKPGDLPVQQPTKFELVINLKTAKTLGLTLSPILLAQADDVVE